MLFFGLSCYCTGYEEQDAVKAFSWEPEHTAIIAFMKKS